MENMEKKEIADKTAVKAFINGFVSYGIIFSFIVFLIIALFRWISQKTNFYSELNFTIITSILKSIIFFFLILFVCRISTYDVLKKCKIKENSTNNISNKMNIFFIICCVFSIMIFTLNLSVKYLNMQNDIYEISMRNYNTFLNTDSKIAEELNNKEITKQKSNWFNYKISTSITEISILISCIYLISYQKKMIILYNK